MTITSDTPPAAPATPPRVTLRARLARAWDSDLAWSFRHSPVAIVATAMTVLLLAASLFAGVIAPQDAFDPAAINLLDAMADRLVQIPGSMPRLTAIPKGCAFNPRCPAVFARCREERPDPIAVGAGEVACWLHSADQEKAA